LKYEKLKDTTGFTMLFSYSICIKLAITSKPMALSRKPNNYL